jgi:hypothetical protein
LTDTFKALAAPFDPAVISWRVGSLTKDKTKARALAYLDARDVMQRLDSVVGPANWQCRYPHAGAMTVCEVGIRIDGEWIWKANGAGHTDIEAEKGALSDAFKRAAVLWGVGQYLYAIDTPWVAINEWKQIDPKELPRLRALLPGSSVTTTKRQARDEWKDLAEELRQKRSLAEIDEFLEKHKEDLTRLPVDWQPRWKELVAQVRGAVQQLDQAA